MSISVLVVEDHAELRTSLEELLTQRGYEVHCASSVEEAVAILNDTPPPCLVLWDPITLKMNGALITHTARHGIHVATVPVSVTSTGQAADGSLLIAKRLTSREAVLSVVREHCPKAEHANAL